MTFVAFDIETTGLTPVVDRIVEIGAVKFRSGKVMDTFQELIDPEMSISPDATAVNGITDEMVAGCPLIDQVLPQFVDFLADFVSIAHNAPFDVGFLSYDFSRLGLKACDMPVLDTCAMPKSVYPHFFSYSLVNLARDLRIRSEGFHRALLDARVCMAIFLKCLAKIGNPIHLTLQDILEINGPALNLNSGEIILDGSFRPLQHALASGNPVEIVYRDARGVVTTRQVTPLSVGIFHGRVMVEAFCHFRNDRRNFRLDRIIDIR